MGFAPVSTPAKDTGTQPPSRPRWYRIYYLLAAFDVLTVLVSLYILARVMGTYAGSVEVNREWTNRESMYEELGQLAGAVAAPGDDVFDSLDVKAELERLRTALFRFNERLAMVRAELRANVAVGEAAPIDATLTAIDSTMAEIVTETQSIFSFFTRHRADLAGRRMATMDRKWATANATLSQLRDQVHRIQMQHLKEQATVARSLQVYEYLIVLSIILMVVGALVYGHKIGKQVELHAREREKYLERFRQATWLAEEASRHKSEFLANMSHELRTPLNAILGFSELLQDPTFGPLNEKQARHLDHIHTSGKHLLALINDLLDLSKIEAGKLDLRCEPFNLAETLETAPYIIRPQAEAKGLALSLTVETALPLLTADPLRLTQILYNLLSNAAKFTPENGRITVTARIGSSEGSCLDPKPYTLCPGEFVEIAVADTGIGITAEDISKLFQPFTQLEPTLAKQYQGTGLGLALTKQLVELHGGRIWAASEGADHGSTFTICLPLRHPPLPPSIETICRSE